MSEHSYSLKIRKPSVKFLAAVFLLIVISYPTRAAYQDTTFRKGYSEVGMLLNAGTIFVHSADVENTSGSRPFGIELEWGKRMLGEDAWRNCHCYPTHGLLLGFTSYDNRVLGSGLHLAYFLEYPFLPYAKVTPVIRGAAGAGCHDLSIRDTFSEDRLQPYIERGDPPAEQGDQLACGQPGLSSHIRLLRPAPADQNSPGKK